MSERIEPVNRPTPTTPVFVSVGREPSTADGPGLIIAAAVAELLARYGSLSPYELSLDASTFDPPRGAFLVARADGGGGPVGGVGVRGISAAAGAGIGGTGDGGAGGSTAEVRRLWVDQAWRGRGVARALMNALEDEAVALGYGSLELGTGYRQPEAVALYETSGWERHRVDRHGGPLPAGVLRFTKLIALKG
jgi:GNAT superfamily N-acetyltransferase